MYHELRHSWDALKHWRYTAEAIARRKEVAELLRWARRLAGKLEAG
jgi:hypothetical protein